MSSAKGPDQNQRLKKQFKITNSALRADWNQHYSTVSGPSASRMKDSFNKDFSSLIPVPEDHHVTYSSSISPTKSSPTSPLPPSSNKSVFRKPNFFSKSKDLPSPTSANISSKSSKTPGKMKNLFSSIRQRSKSSSIENPCAAGGSGVVGGVGGGSVGGNKDMLGDDSVFLATMDEEITPLSLSDYTLNNNNNNNNNSNNNIYNIYNINNYNKYNSLNNNTNNNILNNNNNNSDNSNNTSNNTNTTTCMDGLDIGPDQYIAYHRDRTQSDTTRFLVARKQARDKLNNLKSPATYKTYSKSRHHSAGLDEELGLDTRLLIWKDPKRGTRIYRMPSNSQRFDDSDELITPDLVYNRLLAKHCCYDLVPNSSKIVVFDSRLSIKKAFLALAKDGVKAAILWDSDLQRFSGMLTITDFIKILHEYYHSSDPTTNMQDLENDGICKWKGFLKGRPLICCCPEDTVLKALKLLCQHRVHRLLVLDNRLGNAINILTHKRILAFIHYNMSSIDSPPFLSNPLSSFPNITLNKVTTISYDTKLIEVLKLFIEERISAVPVVDGDGCIVNIFAKFDFSRLAYDHLYSNLDRSVQDVMNSKSESRVDMHTIQPHITLARAIHKIVTASVHRLVMVEDGRRVVGMVTLSDLLRCLVLKGDGDGDDDDEEL